MVLERRVAWYYGDRRKKGWYKLSPLLQTSTIRCAAGDWSGLVTDAVKEQGSYKCPKCGNFIFGGYPFEDHSYRIIDTGEQKLTN